MWLWFFRSPHCGFPYYHSLNLMTKYTLNTVCIWASFKRVHLKMLCCLIKHHTIDFKKIVFVIKTFKWARVYNNSNLIQRAWPHLVTRRSSSDQTQRCVSRLNRWSTPCNLLWSDPLDQVTAIIMYIYKLHKLMICIIHNAQIILPYGRCISLFFFKNYILSL